LSPYRLNTTIIAIVLAKICATAPNKAHIPDVLAAPDYIGRRVHGDRRRVEFVALVGRPPRWLLVSVKFLDEKREAWVNSAYPFAEEHLTGRLRAGTLWRVTRGP
jgi:hypothetical protein